MVLLQRQRKMYNLATVRAHSPLAMELADVDRDFLVRIPLLGVMQSNGVQCNPRHARQELQGFDCVTPI